MGQMEEQWAELCRMIVEADCKSPETERAWKPTLCNKLNFCVCEGFGAQSFHFQQNLVQWLRQYLRIPPTPKTASRKTGDPDPKPDQKTKAEIKREKTPHARRMAEAGFLVLQFQLRDHEGLGTTVANTAASSSSSSSSSRPHAMSQWLTVAEQVAPSECSTPPEFFFYVGFMNFQSFAFAGTELTREQSLPGANVGDEGCLHLSLLPKVVFQRSLDLWKEHVDFNHAWKMKTWILKSRNMPISLDDMVPGKVVVEPFPDIPEMIVWHGKSYEEDKRRRAAQKSTSDKARKQKKPTTSKPKPRKKTATGTVSNPAITDSTVAAAVDAVEQPVVPQNLLDVYGEDEMLNMIEAENEEERNSESDENPPSEDNEDDDFADHAEFFRSAAATVKAKAQKRKAASSSSQTAQPQVKAARVDLAPAPADQPMAAMVAPAVPEPAADSVKRVVTTRTRSGTEVKLSLGALGSIHYYPKSNTFTAFCAAHKNEHSSDCRKSRTSKASAQRPSQGRPLGFLVAWLQEANQHADKSEHVHVSHPSLQACRDGRRHLVGLGDDVQEFLAFERPKRSGEPDEPET